MKKYMVYLDDGNNVFKLAIPANSESDVREYVRGNGEIIAIKDVTSDYPISMPKVRAALKDADFGDYEIDFISRVITDITE